MRFDVQFNKSNLVKSDDENMRQAEMFKWA